MIFYYEHAELDSQEIELNDIDLNAAQCCGPEDEDDNSKDTNDTDDDDTDPYWWDDEKDKQGWTPHEMEIGEKTGR